MIRRIGVGVDLDGTYRWRQFLGHEHEIAAVERPALVVDADRGRMRLLAVFDHPRIDQRGTPRLTGGAVRRACSGSVGLEVEVAAQYRRCRTMHWLEHPAGIAARPRCARMSACFFVQPQQCSGLRHALRRRVVFQMRTDHAQRTLGLAHDGLQRQRCMLGTEASGGQGNKWRNTCADRQPREDRVAELASTAAPVIHIRCRQEQPDVTGQGSRQSAI